MSAIVHALNKRGQQTVRPSDDELHRRARTCLLEAGDALFGNLPSLVGQIIEHKAWRSRPAEFKSFAEYALCQTSDGLNINNNQRLWMLRCAMDITGAHIKEWAAMIERVQEMTHRYIVDNNLRARDFDGNSLEQLSKSAIDSDRKSVV